MKKIEKELKKQNRTQEQIEKVAMESFGEFIKTKFIEIKKVEILEKMTADEIIDHLFSRTNKHLNSRGCMCFNCKIRCNLFALKANFEDARKTAEALKQITTPLSNNPRPEGEQPSVDGALKHEDKK